MHEKGSEMKWMVKVISYIFISALAVLFVLAKCSEPNINERQDQCLKTCGDRGMFGVLEPPFPNSTRNIAANYT